MNSNQSAVDEARKAVIEKLAAYRGDPTDERRAALDEAIEGRHRAVREAVSQERYPLIALEAAAD